MSLSPDERKIFNRIASAVERANAIAELRLLHDLLDRQGLPLPLQQRLEKRMTTLLAALYGEG